MDYTDFKRERKESSQADRSYEYYETNVLKKAVAITLS